MKIDNCWVLTGYGELEEKEWKTGKELNKTYDFYCNGKITCGEDVGSICNYKYKLEDDFLYYFDKLDNSLYKYLGKVINNTDYCVNIACHNEDGNYCNCCNSSMTVRKELKTKEEVIMEGKKLRLFGLEVLGFDSTLKEYFVFSYEGFKVCDEIVFMNKIRKKFKDTGITFNVNRTIDSTEFRELIDERDILPILLEDPEVLKVITTTIKNNKKINDEINKKFFSKEGSNE